MSDRKTPMRMCVVCRNSKPKHELVRMKRTEEGSLLVDKTGKGQGRGAYICANDACIERARSTKVLQKSLKATLSEESYAQLKELVGKNGI
ncbi:MAG: RNase P modulator RnpM [Christensenellaceae bacterium]